MIVSMMMSVLLLSLLPGLAIGASTTEEREWKALHTQSIRAWKAQKYEEAVERAKVAFDFAKQHFGITHEHTQDSLNNLAAFHLFHGQYYQAEPLLVQALALSTKTFGRRDPRTMRRIENLAGAYLTQGRFGEAEQFYAEACELSRSELGENHRNTLSCLANLATVYSQLHRYVEAEKLYKDVLRVQKITPGRRHRDTVGTLVGLAGVLYDQKKYAMAAKIYWEVLEVRSSRYGEKNSETISAMAYFGITRAAQQQYDDAERYLRKALSLSRQLLGDSAPETIRRTKELAMIFRAQGKYARSEEMLTKALELSNKRLGPEHHETLNAYGNLAHVLINQNKHGQALNRLRELEAAAFAFAERELYTIEKPRVRRHFLEILSEFQDLVFSLALKYPSEETKRYAIDVMLRWKLVEYEEEAYRASLIRAKQDGRIVELGEEIAALRSQLSQTKSKQTLQKLDNKERELLERSRVYKTNLAVSSFEHLQLQDALPEESALIEMRIYRPYDFQTGESDPPRFLGLLLIKKKSVVESQLIDFGTVNAIEDWRQNLRRASHTTQVNSRAGSLYQHLFGTIDTQIRTVSTIYIAPDAVAYLIAFSRLVLPDGRYWLERQDIRMLRSGRNLVRHISPTKNRKLIALGGIAFDITQPEESGRPDLILKARNQKLAKDIRKFSFLEASRDEAQEVAGLYRKFKKYPAEVWSSGNATETRLKLLQTPPRILHLATHAFYLHGQREVERPLTLSGLALGGANAGLEGRVGAGGDDGILYALEAMNLNLQGTELVALSACETGAGILEYTDGLYGLVRAFAIAGSKRVLVTLWPVDDRQARDFMVRFYRNWLADPDADPAKSMLVTKLWYIRNSDTRLRDPTIWAPYTLIELAKDY